jgi:hypothetical protein
MIGGMKHPLNWTLLNPPALNAVFIAVGFHQP